MDIYEYLDKFQKFTENPTLKAMEFIMKKLGNPERQIEFVHVAGTNGKGSICEMLSSVLVNQGYKVGKFVTPHLIEYNEEISINNANISDKEIEDVLIQLDPIIKEYNAHNEIKVKWFEVTTSIALKYFADKNCDIVVLETGLGGTTDCTNIVNPIISVIGNIGYDHMDILGNTIEEITAHKAGIIKQNSHTVTTYQEKVTDIISSTCLNKNNILHVINREDVKNYRYNHSFQIFDYNNLNQVCINLKGKEQIYNAAIVLECIEILNNNGYSISENAIREGLKTVVHKARFEILKDNPLVVFDGGHNENAIRNLQKNLRQYYPGKKVIYIISIIRSKDYKTVLKLLLENKDAVFFITGGTGEEKYFTKEELYEEAKKYDNEIYIYDLEVGLKKAIEECKDSLICIAGSFYNYAKTLEILKKI